MPVEQRLDFRLQYAEHLAAAHPSKNAVDALAERLQLMPELGKVRLYRAAGAHLCKQLILAVVHRSRLQTGKPCVAAWRACELRLLLTKQLLHAHHHKCPL